MIELLPYILRDKKWRNGSLNDLAIALINKQDISPYVDIDLSVKADRKWLEKVREEASVRQNS